MANLAAVDAWLVDSQSSGRLTAPVIGELLVPAASWTVSGATGTLNYDVEYSIDGISVYRGPTDFGNGGWFWYRGASYATAGTHTLRITIDPFNTVVETNESDNSFSIQFTTANVSTLLNKFDWPLGGVQGKDWTIINYVDVDPRPGTRADYLGGTFQYDGHDAIDITLANFKTMDSGVPILAAANGTVTEVGDGNFDRNQGSNNLPWNYVRLDNGNGWSTIYGHAMQNSITVKVGDVVAAGDILGYVGSSGNSTGAHLHFTVLHGNWQVETNIAPSQYWKNPLPYMGAVPGNVLSSDITNYDAFSAPTVDIAEGISEQPVISTTGSQTLRFVFNSSHLLVGESWVGKVYSPTNVLLSTSGPFGGWTEPVRGGTWWFSATRTWAAGRYRAVVEVNGVERQSEFFDVAAVVPPQLRVDLNNAIVLDGRTTPINLGSVALNGVSPSASFQLWNHGGSALTITSITASGGFTVPNAPITLQPGERRTVQVNMATSTVGKQFGEIRIVSNDPDNSLYSFNVSGMVTGTAAPSIVTLSTSATPYSVASIPYLLDRNVSITSSNSSFANAVLTTEIRSGANATDRLIIVPQGDGVGQVNLIGNTIKYAGINVGSYTGGFDGSRMRITFNASASLVIINAVAKRIAFQSGALATAPRYVAYTFQEQGASVSPLALKMIVQGKQSASTPSFVVTNTNDSGPGSLRQAILDSNLNPGLDLIQFSIVGVSTTINPATPLPEVTDSVIIDAKTQPGYSGNPVIELDGTNLGTLPNANGLLISSGNSTIRGLAISSFSQNGILLRSGGNNVIESNFIGTDLTGAIAKRNGFGIQALSSDNRIGTDGNGINDVLERNLISGNGTGVLLSGSRNTISGNFIGTNLTGTASIGNAFGVWVTGPFQNNRIGTDGNEVGDSDERNVISGNSDVGIRIVGAAGFPTASTAIAGNYIGLSVDGVTALPNRGNAGIVVNGATLNTRIGTDSNGVGDTAERNVISGNTQEGIQIEGAETTGTTVAGNYIGLNASGTAAVGNASSGILVWGGAKNTRIGTDGNGTGDLAEQNVVSGNAGDGVQVQQAGTDGTIVAGNLIGTDRTGTVKLGNALSGVAVFNGPARTRIGTDGSNDAFNDAERNLISGNIGDGVFLNSAITTEVVLAGNYIGLTLNGVAGLGNGASGVIVLGGVKNTRIGTNGNGIADDAERNLIADNGGDGIKVVDAGTDGTIVAGNYIGTDKNGTGRLGNRYSGVAIFGGPANTRIGTDNSNDAFNASERNVIGFNVNGVYNVDAVTTGTIIAGNYIGVDPTGNLAIPNNDAIYLQAAVNTKVDSNVLSGNTGSGIYLRGALFTGGVGGTGTVFTGNKVGTNASGTAIVGNNGWGLLIDAGSKGTRVGTDGDGVNDEQERNIISGNGLDGIAVGVRETDDTIIRGNYIGTDVSGELDFGNVGYGVTLVEWFFSTSAGSPKRAIVENNVVSGNNGGGVLINGAGSDFHRISGNKIGTNRSGSVAIANGTNGIRISGGAKGNTIGTNGDGVNDSIEGNLISGNSGHGIRITGAGTADNIVAGNLVGTNANGISAMPNTLQGILIDSGALNSRIGTNGNGIGDINERNVLSGNGGSGVFIFGSGTNNSIVSGNFVGTDATGLVRIANGNYGVSVQGGALNTRIGTDGSNNGFDGNEKNVISGNSLINVFLATNVSGTIVAGNFIGVNSAGNAGLVNGSSGVYLFDTGNTRIGTDGNGIVDELERNVIAGNLGDGVSITNSTYTATSTINNVVAGNYIGLNAAGTAAIANAGNGIGVYLGASNTRIGTDGSNDAFNANERNVIGGNGSSGISITDSITTGTVVAGNWIGVNASGNAAVPNASNGVSITRAVAARIGTNADGIADDVERNVVSGNNSNGIQIQGGVQEVFGLTQVDQLIAGTIPSLISTGTITQADFSDVTSPSNGNWAINNPVPGGGGDNYAVVITGTFQVSTAGSFSFAIAGNEGGRLKINGTTIINDDSIHSHSARYGQATLTAGTHTFEWIGFERTGAGGWELSVAVGSGNTTAISTANGWKVVGDPVPHSQIGLSGIMQVTAYYSNQLVRTATSIAGNYVGASATGSSPLGNGANGLLVDGGASDTLVSANLFASNMGAGIRVPLSPMPPATVRNNQFRQNAIGMDLGAAGQTPNDSGDTDGVKNAPVIATARIEAASLVIEGFARPGTEFDLYETATYASGFGQGSRFLASLVEGTASDVSNDIGGYGPTINGLNLGSDNTNRFKFSLPLASLPNGVGLGTYLTAIAVGPSSEFSVLTRVGVSVAANSSVVSGNEGTTITNTGTWSDAGTGDIVTLTASVGTVVKNANGTWSWSLVATDQVAVTTVMISANDGTGGTTFATFTYNVSNAAPTLTRANASLTGNVGTTLTNTGTWGDVPSDTVTLAADIGTILKNADGTWSWSYSPTMAIINQTVTITGSDEDGSSSTVTFTITANSTISTRAMYYANAAGASASTSLATDKQALLPGQASTFANYTNYSRGLNGVVIDVIGLPASVTSAQLAASLEFASWNGIAAAGFVALPGAAVPSVSIVAGGVAGSTRVRITFPDNTVQNTWLRVTVLANATTGLAANDVFYFGNVIGELDFGNTAARLRVNGQDAALILANQSPGANSAGVTNKFDLDRNGRVNGQDYATLLANQQAAGIVAPITAPSARPASEAIRLSNTNAGVGIAAPFPKSVDATLSMVGKTKNSDRTRVGDGTNRLLLDNALPVQRVELIDNAITDLSRTGRTSTKRSEEKDELLLESLDTVFGSSIDFFRLTLPPK